MSDRLDRLREQARTQLPGLLGIDVVDVAGPIVHAEMRVHEGVMAPNGFLHGASVVGLADTACGFGCLMGLPEDSRGFTTIELKTNFVGTATAGLIRCDAERTHGGRTTEVWDVTVTGPDGRRIALFRCTQLILG